MSPTITIDVVEGATPQQLAAAHLALLARYGLLEDGAIANVDETTSFAQLIESIGAATAVDAQPAMHVDGRRCSFTADAYPLPFLEQFARHYARTLEALLRDPHALVAKFELLDEHEKRELIETCNPPAITVTSDDDLVTRFEARAAATPHAVALTCEGRSVTYAQLDAVASTLGAALALDHGLREGDLAAILLERSEWVLLTILAIMKTGAAYLPIDPAYPKARVEHMLRDSGAKLLLSEPPFLSEYEGIDVHTIAERPWRSLPEHCSRSIERLAYTIYTSGSTGVPKGVLLTHRNVARLLESTDPVYRFRGDDVWLLFHSPAFDFSVWEMWGALLYGARLVIPPSVVSRDPQAVYDLVRRERVTVLNQTPSAFRQFDAVDREERARLALRYVIFGGEMLEPSSLREWFERHGDEVPRMVNMYGITETTVHVTIRDITRTDLRSSSVIGRPMDGWRIHLLDRWGNLVPRGVAGEIYVAGDGVALGYLNRAELNAQRFLPDPFSGSGTLYRSGDLARRLFDGDLEYLGRIDHQVKVRGFRIELGEIEHRLLEHPSVNDAAVLPVATSDGVELVAFLFGTEAPRTRELRQFLRRSLPAYMIPSRFVARTTRPLTSNGKLDRRQLLETTAGGVA